jgi:hypothetical protein
MNQLIDGHQMGMYRFLFRIDFQSIFVDLGHMKLKHYLMMLNVEQQFDVIYGMIVRNLVKKKRLNVSKKENDRFSIIYFFY